MYRNLKDMLVGHLLFETSILQLSCYKHYILRLIRKRRETGFLLYYFLLSEKQQYMYATQIQLKNFGLDRGFYPYTEFAGEENIIPFTLVPPYIFLTRPANSNQKSHSDDVGPPRFSILDCL